MEKPGRSKWRNGGIDTAGRRIDMSASGDADDSIELASSKTRETLAISSEKAAPAITFHCD